MTPPPLAEVAGVSLRAPRVIYEVDLPPPAVAPPAAPPPFCGGWIALVRPHAARAIEGASLVLRSPGDGPPATFELTPFLAPAVQSYLPPPAVAWRTLVVDQRLLSHAELIWTGTFPAGWDAGLAAPATEALAEALAALHQRYRSLVEERYADYPLRTLECAECREGRAAKLPRGLPPWQLQMRLSPTGRCPHAPTAMRGLGALCQAHPELTFELLGWLTPAGARASADGPPVTRFALTGPVMEAMLGPWLVGEERRLASRTSYRGYEGSRLWWGRRPDPNRFELPRAQHGGVSLAASAWGFTGEPEALVQGDANAAPPGLDRAAAPLIEAGAVLPGEVLRGKRARRGRKG